MKEKELYYSPETVVIDLKMEGVICASGDLTAPDFENGGQIF